MSHRDTLEAVLHLRRVITLPDAMMIARSLWGSYGAVEVRNSDPRGPCFVGTKGALPGERVYGFGKSWEEAFVRAVRGGYR